MIFYIIFGVLLFVTYHIFKPLYYIIIYKIRHGGNCTARFFPVFGEIYFFFKNKGKDPRMNFDEKMLMPPYPKFTFSNLFGYVLICINDPDYYKQIIIQHEKFAKFNSICHEYFVIFYDSGLISKGMVMQEGTKWHD